MLSTPVVVAACVALASTWAAASFLFRKKEWDAKGKVRLLRLCARQEGLHHPALHRDWRLRGPWTRARHSPSQRGCTCAYRRAQPGAARQRAEGRRGACACRRLRSARSRDTPQAARQSPDQIFKTYSYALDSAKEAEACLDAVSAASGGRCPDALFLCAGKSRPGFWVERTEEELRECMEETYWVQAWPALVSRNTRSRGSCGWLLPGSRPRR